MKEADGAIPSVNINIEMVHVAKPPRGAGALVGVATFAPVALSMIDPHCAEYTLRALSNAALRRRAGLGKEMTR